MQPGQHLNDAKSENFSRLDKLRVALQLSWGEYASLIGVSRQMLQRVRSGERDFSPKKWRRIAELEAETWKQNDALPEPCLRDPRAEYGCRFDESARGRLANMETLLVGVLAKMEQMEVALGRLLEADGDADADGKGDVKAG